MEGHSSRIHYHYTTEYVCHSNMLRNVFIDLDFGLTVNLSKSIVSLTGTLGKGSKPNILLCNYHRHHQQPFTVQAGHKQGMEFVSSFLSLYTVLY